MKKMKKDKAYRREVYKSYGKLLLFFFFLILIAMLFAYNFSGNFKKDNNQCYVDTDCRDYKQYCEVNEFSSNYCLQFSCGKTQTGLGDFWTCGDTNLCVEMCRFNYLDGKCYYQEAFINTLYNQGCHWHKQRIIPPKGGFKEGDTIDDYGWVCG